MKKDSSRVLYVADDSFYFVITEVTTSNFKGTLFEMGFLLKSAFMQSDCLNHIKTNLASIKANNNLKPS